MKSTENLKAGDIVRYTDMANPTRTYVIVETPNEAHPYDFKMLCITADEDTPGYDNPLEPHFSSCRQHGWELVKTAWEI